MSQQLAVDSTLVIEARDGRSIELRAARPSQLRHALIAFDFTVLAVALTGALAVANSIEPVPNNVVRGQIAVSAVLLPVWLLIMGGGKLFTARATSRRREEFRLIVVSNLVAVGLLVTFGFVVQFDDMPRLWVGLVFTFSTVGLVLSREGARRYFRHLRRTGRIRRPVLIVGTGPDALDIHKTIDRHPELGYEVVGFVGDPTSALPGSVLGPTTDALAIAERTGAVGAIMSVSSIDAMTLNDTTRALVNSGLHVCLSSSLFDIDVTRARPQELDGHLMIYVEPVDRSRSRLALKRVFDLVLAGIVIVITMPLLVVAAIAVKIDSPGPVLFRQRRLGLDGVPFEILKLRTMRHNAESELAELMMLNEADGPLFKILKDPRITRVGAVLRRTSIDELPQLFNVVKGDMSIVGPRPALASEADQWCPELFGRLTVMPGITGLWQVSGRSDTDFGMYRRLDLYYVDNWSLLHDLEIVAKTIGVVLTGRGAH